MNDLQPITQPERLLSLCEQLGERSLLGLDTEFERRNTFYARLALVQIHDGEHAYLVDPLALNDLMPLAGLVDNAERTVVMHAPLEDLEILHRVLGRVPPRIFDTQLAAALAGLGAGLGYDRLVQALFDVGVSKSATRSDWLRRPLSRAQLDYAAIDTAYLLPAHAILDERLERLGRRHWLDEEVAQLVERMHTPEAGRDFVRLVRRVADDDQDRGALMALCQWREGEARRKDIPRRRLLEDNLMVACVNQSPSSEDELREIPDFDQLKRRLGTRELLQVLQQARTAPSVARPPEGEDLRPLKAEMRSLKSALEPVCEALALPAEVLAPKRMMEQLVVATVIRNEPPPAVFMGWRKEAVLPALLDALASG